MAEQTARFAIEVDDKSGGSAKNLASELEGLKGSLIGDLAEVRNMSTALRNLRGGAGPNGGMEGKLKDQIAAQEAAIAATQARYVALGGSFKAMKKPQEDTGQELSALRQVTDQLPGSLGRVTKGLREI